MLEARVNGLVRDPIYLDMPELLISKAFLPTNAALYYNITMNPAVALFFGWVGSFLDGLK